MRSRRCRLVWCCCLAVLLVCLGAVPAGCSRRSSSSAVPVFTMGERVEVGPLIYVVQDVEWRDRFGEGLQMRTPRHRFLLVRLSVTNSGIRETNIPPLSLLASDGHVYAELERAEGVPEWLGYLRAIPPAATEHGRVVFDVPGGAYRLRVAAVLEDDNERAALVELPYQGIPSPQLPLTTPGAPSR